MVNFLGSRRLLRRAFFELAAESALLVHPRVDRTRGSTLIRQPATDAYWIRLRSSLARLLFGPATLLRRVNLTSNTSGSPSEPAWQLFGPGLAKVGNPPRLCGNSERLRPGRFHP